MKDSNKLAQPFFKWVGGKRQIADIILLKISKDSIMRKGQNLINLLKNLIILYI